jgi:hypothetical protein
MRGNRNVRGCPSGGGGSTICWSLQERLIVSIRISTKPRDPENPSNPGNIWTDPGARDMIYSESDTGSVWLFRQAF